MSKIKCRVTHCVSNKYTSCIRPKIDVRENEEQLNDIFCSSFKEKRMSDFQTEYAYQDFPMLFEVDIDCDSYLCRYNNEHKCKKHVVEITGTSATKAEDSSCDSFEPR